jgi:DNA repair protein RadC
MKKEKQARHDVGGAKLKKQLQTAAEGKAGQDTGAIPIMVPGYMVRAIHSWARLAGVSASQFIVQAILGKATADADKRFAGLRSGAKPMAKSLSAGPAGEAPAQPVPFRSEWSGTPRPRGALLTPKEFKVTALRECAPVNEQNLCDNPPSVYEYWMANVATHPYFNPDCECFVVLLLNTRRKAVGPALISVGLLDTILVHPRETFRAAVTAGASAIVLMHNHPSGDPGPSEGDIKITENMVRAGQMMKIQVLDHVIVGAGEYKSLRALGYFRALEEKPK